MFNMIWFMKVLKIYITAADTALLDKAFNIAKNL